LLHVNDATALTFAHSHFSVTVSTLHVIF